MGVNVKRGGTYICMGVASAFSTKAESNIYRSWNMDVIGMTNLQEAKLAREAEICYVTIAMITDYDCWHEEHDAVQVTDIIRVLQQNAANACQVIARAVKTMPTDRICKCGSALQHALITDKALIPPNTIKKLEPIVGKYFCAVKRWRPSGAANGFRRRLCGLWARNSRASSSESSWSHLPIRSIRFKRRRMKNSCARGFHLVGEYSPRFPNRSRPFTFSRG